VDELFVFSDRVPNSLDSRYFGPVSTRQVLGVYTRLPLLSEAR
jgi:type IV secretory pathway protease TraF